MKLLSYLLLATLQLLAADSSGDSAGAHYSLPQPCEVEVLLKSIDRALDDPIPQVKGKKIRPDNGSEWFVEKRDFHMANINAWTATEHGVLSNSIYAVNSVPPLPAHVFPELPANVDSPFKGAYQDGINCTVPDGIDPPEACLASAKVVEDAANARLAKLKAIGVCR